MELRQLEYFVTVAEEANFTRAALAQLAARGLGVAILPAPFAEARDDLHTLRIVRPELRGRLAFVRRAEGAISPAAKAFVDRAIQMLDR